MARNDAENLHALLAQERIALRSGALKELAPILEQKEVLVSRFASDGLGCTAVEAALLRAEVARNGALLDATRRGLRHVMDRIAERGRVARQLDTYDAHGQRKAIATQPASVHRTA